MKLTADLNRLYNAIESLPAGVTGELVNGQLYAHPRQSARHGFSTSNLSADLVNPFARGRGGPGGWWIIDEPEVHLVLHQEVCAPNIGDWVPVPVNWSADHHTTRVAPFDAIELLALWA